MFILIVILIFFLLFKKCNIEKFTNVCKNCLNICNNKNSIPYCIDKCYRIGKKCNNRKDKKKVKKYKKYYNLHHNNKYFSYDGQNIFLSKDKKAYIPFKINKKTIQSKIDCFNHNKGCNKYLGVKNNKINLFHKNEIKNKERKWNMIKKKNHILLKHKNKYLNSKMQLVKGEKNAAKLGLDQLLPRL